MAIIVKPYTSSPTLTGFHQDHTSFVKYVTGPVGSGKSSGCIMELLMRAIEQQPDDNNVRRTRWGIVRNTYPELKSTTIRTYQEWVPTAVAPVVYSTPIASRMQQKLSDGTMLDMEVIFLALDSSDDVSKLLSLELTGVFINETREIPWEVMEALISRIPRFPNTIKDEYGRTLYGPTRPGIVCDSNAPRNTHWLYEKFEIGATPEGWRKYQQPPAIYYDDEKKKWELNPDAENLSHLDDKYYYNQIVSASDDFLRVNLGNEFGMSRKGKPVFAKFSEHKHVAKETIISSRGAQLIVGLDFGLQPGCVLGQLAFSGLRLVDELPATDESLEDFLDEYLLPLLATKYPGYNVVACGDPAGVGRSGLDKRTPFEVLRSRGIKAFPAPTNNFIPRKEAVDYFLSRDGGFSMSPHMTFGREAMGGGYIFKETKSNTGVVADKPLKNKYSHWADALQYLCMHARHGGRYTMQPATAGERKAHLWA